MAGDYTEGPFSADVNISRNMFVNTATVSRRHSAWNERNINNIAAVQVRWWRVVVMVLVMVMVMVVVCLLLMVMVVVGDVVGDGGSVWRC